MGPIKNGLLQEMSAQIQQLSPFKPTPSPSAKNQVGVSFSDLLAQAINHVRGLQRTSADLSTRLDMGDSKVTLSDTVIAREKAAVAFSATMEVRNKFVEAYQSIMSMPI